MGIYLVEGNCPKWPAYTGEVTVSNCGENYRVEWRIAEKTYAGTAVSRDRLLAVAYSREGIEGFGVGIFEFSPDGNSAHGSYTDHGGLERGTERWIRLQQ